jgi:hypothetical protein
VKISDSSELVKPEKQPAAVPGTPPSQKLVDRALDGMRLRHFSIRTGQAYVDWIRRFSVP